MQRKIKFKEAKLFKKKKRKFQGNRYTKQSCSEPKSNLYISASAKKLKVLEETLENAGNQKDIYNFVMNFNIIKDVITEIVKCPECECTVTAYIMLKL